MNTSSSIMPSIVGGTTHESALDFVSQVYADINKLLPANHGEVLTRLLDQIEPIDFQALAYESVQEMRIKLKDLDPKSPQAKQINQQMDQYKINENHYLVIGIEHVLKVAQKNNWNMSRNQDFLYIYNGCFWKIIDKGELQSFLGKASELMGVPTYKARLYQFQERLLKQFMSAAHLPTPESMHGHVNINLLNGTYHITGKNNKLRSFDSKDFITYQLPFRYDTASTAPIFQAYLDRCIPDISKQMVLAEFLGYVFIPNGALKLEKALILYGNGANGKSVFNELVNALLGNDNVSSYPLDLLTDSTGYYRAKIGNKLVNYASEIGSQMNRDYFKQMTSGEPISARLPYGNPMTLTQYAKLVFNCNELPKEIEHSNAFYRRFLIIPFDVTIPEHDQDKELHRKIIDSELSGIFNWVLDGLNRLLAQKRFTHCEASMIALDQYKLQSDSVKLYLEEKNLVKSPDQYKPLKDMYHDYRAFCNEDGNRPVNKSNFTKRLMGLGIVIERLTPGKVAYMAEALTPETKDKDELPF